MQRPDHRIIRRTFLGIWLAAYHLAKELAKWHRISPGASR